MEGQNCTTAVTITTAAAQPSSVSIAHNQAGIVSKLSLGGNQTSVGGGLMCVVGQDGQTLILSDAEGRENIISGVTPDILQQVNGVLKGQLNLLVTYIW